MILKIIAAILVLASGLYLFEKIGELFMLETNKKLDEIIKLMKRN